MLSEAWVEGVGNDNSGRIVTDEIAPVEGAPVGEVVGTGTGCMIKFSCRNGETVFWCACRSAVLLRESGGFTVAVAAFAIWVVGRCTVPVA